MSLLTSIQNWGGVVEIDNSICADVTKIDSKTLFTARSIKLLKNRKNANNERFCANADTPTVYEITVKKYMTHKSTPNFDFMKKWNDDKPMPAQTMRGIVLEETKGMIKMELRCLPPMRTSWTGWIIKAAILSQKEIEG